MKRYFFFVAVTAILFGCASADISEEKKKKMAVENQKLEKDMKHYIENILKPVVFTALATCAYKLDTGNWPTRITHVKESELLANYNVNSENPFAVEFQVKPSIVVWQLQYTQIDNDCLYTLSINTDNIQSDSNNFQVLTRMKGHINKKALTNLNRDEINKYLDIDPLSFSFNYVFFRVIDLKLYEKKIPEKRNKAFDGLVGILVEGTIYLAFCALIGALDGNC